MPKFAPLVKVARCQRFGAKVILHGHSFEEARAYASQFAHQRQLAYVHPFDDLNVIAGQGTVALDILEQVPDLEAVVVPVGGGGLLAGVATVLRALKPEVTIIGVEPGNAPKFSEALNAGKPVHVPARFTLADGLAVAEAGQNTFAIASSLVDRVITVREEALALAILRLAEAENAIVEGAGAAPLAALLSSELPELADKKVVLLLSGGNIDPLTHSRVIEKGLAAYDRI